MRKVSLLIIPVVGMLLSSCGVDNATASKTLKENKTPVVSISQKEVSINRLYVSDIQAVQNVEIRSRIPGFLEKIYVDEGRPVKKGQLLFKISDEEYKADVAKNRANLANIIAEARTVELEAERVKLLVEKKIVSPSELQIANAKLRAIRARIDESQAALDHALTRLSYTNVKAPYDGVVDRIPLKIGSLLDEGTLITSISDISSVFAYFNISENEYLAYLRANAQKDHIENKVVRLILSDGKEYELPGNIETVVSEFNESTGSIAFRARFPNPNHLLKHGATGKVQLTSEVDDALLLPQKAVFEIQDKNYVYVLDNANKIHARSFIPKVRLGDFYVVESGLKSGERVVYEGIQNLKDGMTVSPHMVQADNPEKKSLL